MLILYNFIKMLNFKMINVLLQWKQKSIISNVTRYFEPWAPRAPDENQNLALGVIGWLVSWAPGLNILLLELSVRIEIQHPSKDSDIFPHRSIQFFLSTPVGYRRRLFAI